MHIFGKILGAFWLPIWWPFGAIFGIFLGHQFDKARRLNQAGFQSGTFGAGPSQAERQEEFFKSAFSVMGHVAKPRVKSPKKRSNSRPS